MRAKSTLRRLDDGCLSAAIRAQTEIRLEIWFCPIKSRIKDLQTDSRLLGNSRSLWIVFWLREGWFEIVLL